MSKPSRCAIGVDGCPGGWIAAVKIVGQPIAWHFAPAMAHILQAAPPKARILVDMILGLPHAAQPKRLCDSLARLQIAPHTARVFSAPLRETLLARDYAEACALSRQASGKALSKQAFNLLPKIRELDALASDRRLREAHPELVFARFNNGHPVATSKKTPAGQAERCQLLESVLPGSAEALELANRHLRRKQAAPDDCLDALALCAAAIRPEQLIRLPEDPALPGIWF